MVVYFPWFFALEAAITTNYTAMHCKIDDLIQFNEWFIIPYYLWFPFVSFIVLYLLFTNKTDYYKCCAYLFTGMTICLLIYTIWPNGQNLRPDLSTLGRDNYLIGLVSKLYATDTNTNVCPSIHVYNSIGVVLAIYHNDKLKRIPWVKYGAFILAVFICLSTVYLKQHSVVDGICASTLAIVMYALVYRYDVITLLLKSKGSRAIVHNAK